MTNLISSDVILDDYNIILI